MNTDWEKECEEIVDIAWGGFGHSDTDSKICSSFYSKRGNKYMPHGKNNHTCDCGAEERKEEVRVVFAKSSRRQRLLDIEWLEKESKSLFQMGGLCGKCNLNGAVCADCGYIRGNNFAVNRFLALIQARKADKKL